ncbi:hypothetical protein PMI23_02841 [Pseudomonas sp. GM24]|jgi:hypothetical protein|nr:hypothetical protein PMI19_05752 [Pseudomonas sp. GM16]EJM37981.1 hypothetical protein PMI23_02841 [Pseudomonas sp. GM24]
MLAKAQHKTLRQKKTAAPFQSGRRVADHYAVKTCSGVIGPKLSSLPLI